jgi:phenylpropionate dioxygenase-like ring-hydroxylating dioxygenase large terminal subunit
MTSAMTLGFWYPIVLTRHLRRGTLTRQHVAGVPIVMGRDRRGAPFAFLDHCPHRGMPLSFARFDGGTLECAYHGWRFDAQTGTCQAIPSLPSDTTVSISKITATRVPAVDRDGHVWVYLADPLAPGAAPPPPPTLPVFSARHHLTHLAVDVGCGFDEAVISLIDPAHGPFVHRAWWWRKPRMMYDKSKVFEPIPDGFRIPPHEPSGNSAPYKVLRLYRYPKQTTIEFHLPSTRLEVTRCGPYWFSSRTVVTPIDANRCRLDFCAAWNMFRMVPLVSKVFRFFGGMFLRQDKRSLERLALGLAHGPSTMLLGDADTPARWYLQLRTAYLNARRSGEALKHPLEQPTRLRWRS